MITLSDVKAKAFDHAQLNAISGAVFDRRQEHQYLLWRNFTGSDCGSSIAFIMLNPSSADASYSDPTIKRVECFVRAWGYERLLVVNLFSLRSAVPRDLLLSSDPAGIKRGRDNDDWIGLAAQCADRIVLAWGAFVDHRPHFAARSRDVLSRLPKDRCSVLGLTAGGVPRHPLYLKKDTLPSDAPTTLWL